MGRDTGLPTSSSLFSSRTISRSSEPASASISMAVKAMATPAFMSSVPGPHRRPWATRQGMVLSVPSGHTVSMCPRSSARFTHPYLRRGPNRASITSPKARCRWVLTRPPSARACAATSAPQASTAALSSEGDSARTSVWIISSSADSLRRAPASRARIGTQASGEIADFGLTSIGFLARDSLILRGPNLVRHAAQIFKAGAKQQFSDAKCGKNATRHLRKIASNLTSTPPVRGVGVGILAQPAHLEQTIAEPIAFEGVGLHSGAPVNMRLLPAPAGSGIVFRRTDLDNFEIPAVGRNVAKVRYATSLMLQGVLISTTEHLLSALIGIGVDNVIVELDNLELPILDGSAQSYVQAILRAGIRTQRRRRETIRVLHPVEVREGDKFIGVYPGSGYRIEYTIDFPAPIGRQKSCIDLSAETYGTSIDAARTFGYKADEQRLRDMGLIRGASPENAIILGASGPENGPLRFVDEYVRHKVLDLIGDLALAGRRIEGHVVAERAGHAMHTALVSRLIKDRSAWELAHVPVESATAEEASGEDAAPATSSSASVSAPALAGA